MITKILSFELDDVIFDIVARKEPGDAFTHYSVMRRGKYKELVRVKMRATPALTDAFIINYLLFETENKWHFEKMQ